MTRMITIPTLMTSLVTYTLKTTYTPPQLLLKNHVN